MEGDSQINILNIKSFFKYNKNKKGTYLEYSKKYKIAVICLKQYFNIIIY